MKPQDKNKIGITAYYKEKVEDGGGVRDFNWSHKYLLRKSIAAILKSDKYKGYYLYAFDVHFFKNEKAEIRIRFGQQAITKGPRYLKKLLEL